MQDPEQIKRFTRSAAMMKDPPWLPMALWVAVVPALAQTGVIGPVWWVPSLALAAIAAALGSRWFKRTHGEVTLPADSFQGRVNPSHALVLLIAVWTLEVLSNALGLHVRLGFVAFGAWLFWGARASGGVRPHLYVLAVTCVGVAFIPLIGGGSVQEPRLLGSIILTAFGLGWAYVCIQDYRALNRNPANVQR